MLRSLQSVHPDTVAGFGKRDSGEGRGGKLERVRENRRPRERKGRGRRKGGKLRGRSARPQSSKSFGCGAAGAYELCIG